MISFSGPFPHEPSNYQQLLFLTVLLYSDGAKELRIVIQHCVDTCSCQLNIIVRVWTRVLQLASLPSNKEDKSKENEREEV